MTLAEIREHLNRFQVGIAGAGGLGSNCAVALARCGVGTLVICDFDVVEESNLSRQYYFSDQIGMMKTAALKENISRIDPSVKVLIHNIKLEPENIPGLFASCNIVVEAFDSAAMKKMLIETMQNNMPGIPLVVGSGLAGWGKSDEIKFRKLDKTLYVCGDESSETGESLPPLAPRVGMVANMQANVVIGLLMEMRLSKSVEI
jgi:sulfur carrier protein ThiS adenylyltransferase